MTSHLRYFILVPVLFLACTAKAEIVDTIVIAKKFRKNNHGLSATRRVSGRHSDAEFKSNGGSTPIFIYDKLDPYIRFYTNNQVCIYADELYKITKVVLKFHSSKTTLREEEYTLNAGSYDAGSCTWTGESDIVCITNKRTSTKTEERIRLTALYIHLSKTDAPPATPTVESIRELTSATENSHVRLNIRSGKVIYTQDGKAYVHDNSGIVCVENPNIPWKDNDALNGTIEGTYGMLHGVPTLQVADDAQVARLTVTSSPTTLNPTDITVDQLKDNAYQYVCLKEITPDQLKVSDFFNLNTTLPYPGALFNVTGYVLPLPAAEGTGETSYHVCPVARNGIEFLFKDKMQNTVSEASRVRVKLTRTLLADTWNTLCLPFSVSASQINSIFGKARIREFEKVENDVFLFKECDSIQGGKPYLFNPSRTVADPCFDDVTLVSQPQSIINGGYGFVGVFSPYEMQTDGTQLFLNNGNLKKPSVSSNKMAGMRAYFVIPPDAKHSKFFLFSDDVTGIRLISGQAKDKKTGIYRMDGKKINASKTELRKGIYIINGQKTIIQ